MNDEPGDAIQVTVMHEPDAVDDMYSEVREKLSLSETRELIEKLQAQVAHHAVADVANMLDAVNTKLCGAADNVPYETGAVLTRSFQEYVSWTEDNYLHAHQAVHGPVDFVRTPGSPREALIRKLVAFETEVLGINTDEATYDEIRHHVEEDEQTRLVNIIENSDDLMLCPDDEAEPFFIRTDADEAPYENELYVRVWYRVRK